MVKWFALVLCLLAPICTRTTTAAQEGSSVDQPHLTRLWVVVETPANEEPVEQEMVLLSVRGAYDMRINIALDTLVQPDLKHFAWAQLGRDRWGQGVTDGYQVRTFERRLAVFPQRPGSLQISSFTHRLTLASSDGSRRQHEVRSAPVAVSVQAKPSATHWWLPAQGIKITDEWDRPPDQLVPGDLAKRTVSLEAIGVMPQALPPSPDMKGSGVIVFTDPEERSSRVTPNGPISRVTWRWTLRPVSSSAGELRPVTIPWFDTSTRQMRELTLARQTIGLAQETALPKNDRRPGANTVVSHTASAGVLAGLLCGLALFMPGLRLRPAAELRDQLGRLVPSPRLKKIKRAARNGDIMAARNATAQWLLELSRRGCVADPTLLTALADLDRHLFAPGHITDARRLRKLAQALVSAGELQRRRTPSSNRASVPQERAG
jgi:hypothetical protein